jgi:hypothetical protein
VINQFTGLPRADMTTTMRLKMETELKTELLKSKDYKGEVFAIYYNQFLID